MTNRGDLFLAMFRAEAEDSLVDARSLWAAGEKRHLNDEITNYVHNENRAYLTQLISSLQGVLKYLDTVPADRERNVEDIAAEIENMVRREVFFEDPEAVAVILGRKIKKILTYMKMQAD